MDDITAKAISAGSSVSNFIAPAVTSLLKLQRSGDNDDRVAFYAIDISPISV